MVDMAKILQKVVKNYEERIGDSIVFEDKYVITRSLDSLEIMQIVVDLEEEFDIEFEVDELDTDLFNDVYKVCEVLSGKVENE